MAFGVLPFRLSYSSLLLGGRFTGHKRLHRWLRFRLFVFVSSPSPFTFRLPEAIPTGQSRSDRYDFKLSRSFRCFTGFTGLGFRFSGVRLQAVCHRGKVQAFRLPEVSRLSPVIQGVFQARKASGVRG